MNLLKALVVCTCLSLAASAGLADTQTYTNAADIAAAIENPRCNGRRFSLTARVSMVLQAGITTTLWVEDASGRIAVNRFTPVDPPKPGDLVRFSGHIQHVGHGLRDAIFDDLRVLSSGPAPAFERMQLEDIRSGRANTRLIRIRGTLRSAAPSDLSPNWLITIITIGNETLVASAPKSPELLDRLQSLIDSTIDLDCVCLPRDLTRRWRAGRVLNFSGLDAVHLVERSPEDPFAVPDIATIDFLQPADIAALGRHKVRGRVLAVWGANQALLRLSSGDLSEVTFRQPPLPSYGDVIEATGFPETNFHYINLTSAIWRMSDGAETPSPTAEDTCPREFCPGEDDFSINPQFHGKPVHLSGRLRSMTAHPDTGPILHIESGSALVRVDARAFSLDPALLERGARLAITGTCIINFENWRPRVSLPQVRGFFIVPRTAADIRVIARPPWWTPRRLLSAIGILLVLLVGIIIWNRALQILATRKGRELLREQIGHVKAELKTAERTRLAIELHDSIAQNLTGVSMEIESALRSQEEGLGTVVGHIAVADKALKSCRIELRNTLWDLRNLSLEERDLNKAIERALLPHVKGITLHVRFNCLRSKLTDNTVHDVLRIIRELAINGIRHGGASAIRIAGSIDGKRLLFSVRDNGCGFDPNACPGVDEGHFGLQGLRERLGALDGALSFTSAPGQGTRADVSLNIDNPDSEDKS